MAVCNRQVPRTARRNLLYAAVVGTLYATASLIASAPADARLVKFVVSSKESPTFGGYSFYGVGQYEKIVGMAYGELDPNDPRNALITDIQLAPRNANGKVEYSHTFYILKPIDLTKGAHRMMYEPPNRGSKTVSALNRGVGSNDPGSITDPTALANSFLMPRGYTLAFSGWDFAAGTSTANFNSIINLPVAHNPDGSTITGPAYEYFVNGNATTTSYTLNYKAATLDQSKAVLTDRVHLNDVPTVIPASGWTYNADGSAISLVGKPFNNADIYEFSYTAKDPTVNGIGFAAVRDFVAWLRYAAADDVGTPNPMAGDISKVYTEISSQPGRMLNDFRNLGFNESENHQKVFDGLMQWIAAADGINMNLRFSQPGRTERNRQDHLYAEGVFPFSNESQTDHITGKTAGRYDRCTQTNTCPFAVEIWSANEYWVKAASLFLTDTKGTKDLAGHPLTRYYFMSSMQHGTGNGNSKGVCQQFQNPLDSSPVQRALFIALDNWATNGVPPPDSRVPRLADGTLAPPLPQSAVGFPSIPGVTYNGLKTTRYRFNYGPRFDQGIMDINPPNVVPSYQDNPLNGPIYPSYVPTTDADGNDIAGVRLPDVRVPLNTYTGWALRAAGQGENDGCEGSGQRIPFPATKAARQASGDPRLSIEERYPTFLDYYFKVTKAVNDMVAEGFLLAEDAGAQTNRLLNAGFATGAIKMDVVEEE
ncbi:MAG TPA: alpha/beta hydrolase domain-containing protein [Casimicrobiaceae bacterium]|nr:alpha/beta hydrolase domain-containing protein [Casimicrobiaceae bacterium]